MDCRSFDRGFFECASEAGERVAVVEVVEVAFMFAGSAGDVEAGFYPRSRKRDVAPLLEASFARSENKRALNGKTLSRVAGQRIRVADVAGLEVPPGELDPRPPVGPQAERALV